MIADLDIGCWHHHPSLSVPAIYRCQGQARPRGKAGVELLQKDNILLAEYSVGRGNNNGNGNTGSFNGNFNNGNNNGNFNSSNGNGNCFTSDNNENHDAAMYNWDYKRLMQELQRCGITPRKLP